LIVKHGPVVGFRDEILPFIPVVFLVLVNRDFRHWNLISRKLKTKLIIRSLIRKNVGNRFNVLYINVFFEYYKLFSNLDYT